MKLVVLRKYGVGFNEGSTIKYLPTIHINQPKGLFYSSYWPIRIRLYYYKGKIYRGRFL